MYKAIVEWIAMTLIKENRKKRTPTSSEGISEELNPGSEDECERDLRTRRRKEAAAAVAKKKKRVIALCSGVSLLLLLPSETSLSHQSHFGPI